MLKGYGAAVLAHTPKDCPGLPARGIQALFDPSEYRVPSTDTIREHLHRLEEMGLVGHRREGRELRYWRLVDSVFDSPVEVST